MQGTGSKWAWLQLGLQHLDNGDAGEAIKALQHVIRADPNDKYIIAIIIPHCKLRQHATFVLYRFS